VQSTLDGFLPLTLGVHQRAEDIGEHVMETHGDFASGNGHLPEALGQMRAVPFEDSRTERGPDQSLGDVGLGGIEGVQTRIALPLFEHQLHFKLSSLRQTVYQSATNCFVWIRRSDDQR
jgi:hypothetical protein